MTSETTKPAIGADGELRGLSSTFCTAEEDSHSSPECRARQAKSRARLRLVAPPPPVRQRRIDVHISAREGPAPHGRSRPFRLTLDELLELIAHLESIEGRR